MDSVMEFLTDVYNLEVVQNLLDAIIKLSFTVLFSGIIGYEREHSHRPAGFRTHILVAVGATIVMMTSKYVLPSLFS